jgi:hypothetical protein
MVGTFRERLATVSRARIEEAIESERKTLAAGALPKMRDVKYHCGIIKGLEIALAAIDGAETDLQQG